MNKYNLFNAFVVAGIASSPTDLCIILRSISSYFPKDPSMNSETFRYKRGVSQVFSQPTHVIDPSKYPETEVCTSPPTVRWIFIGHDGNTRTRFALCLDLS